MNEMIQALSEQSPILASILGIAITGVAWVYRELRKAISSLQNKIDKLELKVENYQLKVQELRYTIGRYEGERQVGQVVLDSLTTLQTKLEVINSKL